MSLKSTKIHILFSLVCLVGTNSCNQESLESCLFTYLNKENRKICIKKWGDIPDIFRSTAKPLLEGESPNSNEWRSLLPLKKNDDKQVLSTIYQYRNQDGRLSFTNIWDDIPVGQHQKAKIVDLSNVSLNTQVGNEINRSLTQQYESLLDSDYCSFSRERKSKDWFTVLWTEYRAVCLIAFIMIVFVLLTPFALRRMNAPDWARVLTTAIQTLSFIGLMVFTSIYMGKTSAHIKISEEIDTACEPSTWAKLETQPNPIAKRMMLLKDLKKQVEMIDAERRTNKRGIDK